MPRFAPALVLFLVMVAHALLETARDALLLTRLGSGALGWAYVAIAVTAFAAVSAVRRWGRARDPRSLLLGFLVVAVAGTAVLAAVIGLAPWLAFVLYVWTGLVATLVVPAFWLVVDRDVRIGEAKRTVAAIAAGGGFGALVGSVLAGVLGELIGARHLVTAGGIGFVLATLSVWVLPPPRPAAPPAKRARPATVDESHRTRRYAQLLIVLAVVSTVTLTLGDLMFKQLLVERVPGDQLATVFGATYAGLNVLALVIQLAVTPRLLDRVGVGSALGVLPVIVLATTLGFAVTGAAVAVFALKLADGGLRNSVHRVASEILFLPLPSTERERTKPLAEAFGQRGGQALAAGLAIAIGSGVNGTWTIAVAIVASAVVWLIVTAATRRAYVRRFRDTLDAADIQREVSIPALDEQTIELVTSSLSSPDEREAIAALDLLAQHGERIPALVLYHPSAVVVRHALSLLEGGVRDDVARVLGQLTEHRDPQIRASALAASSRTGCHHARLLAALGDPEPDVRAAAVVGLSALDVAQPALAAMIAGSQADRVALAHAIGRAPGEPFRPVLLQLLARREPAVTREVLRAWQFAPALAELPRLLKLLEDPHVRDDARRVLIAVGEPSLELLVEALDDPRTSIGVRRHLPRTISRFRSPVASAALVERLRREPDGTTEFKILRALGRMRSNDPALALDPLPVRAYVKRSTEDAIRYARLGAALEPARSGDPASAHLPGLDLLRELLVEKRDHAIERVFRALGILYPRDDLRSIHDALVGDDDERRGAAREILDNLVGAEQRGPLLEALAPPDEPLLDDTEAIAALLADPSDSLRCVAAYHVAERRMIELRGELVRLQPLAGSEVVTRAFEHAIARLDLRSEAGDV